MYPDGGVDDQGGIMLPDGSIVDEIPEGQEGGDVIYDGANVSDGADDNTNDGSSDLPVDGADNTNGGE